MTDRLAALILWAAGRLVPSGERRRWTEEWKAEIHALRSAPRPGAEGAGVRPSLVWFVAGAVPHAIWLRGEHLPLRGLGHDVRLALRMLRRAPGFTAAAMLTLALGIGVNGAIFSLVSGLILRAPEGVAEADRLVQIGRTTDEAPTWGEFSWPNARRLMEVGSGPFEAVGGFSIHQFTIGEGPDAEPVFGHFVTGGWFDMLGTVPAAGRLIQPSDETTIGGHPVIVLSHGLWTRRWGADPRVVGTTVAVDGTAYEVIGVAPEGFVGIHNVGIRPEVFVPAMMNPGYRGDLPFDSWRWSWLSLAGRLRPGAEPAQVAEVEASWTRLLREAHPDNAGSRVVVTPGVGVEPYRRDQTLDLSRTLVLVVTVVLLLTCASVANLFLARATHRRSEIGVRTALGAGRARVARQLLTESVVVAGGATLLAVPLVAAAVGWIPGFVPLEVTGSIAPNGGVWAFLGGVGLLTALACGLAPAWMASRTSVAVGLREGAATGGVGRGRLRDALVVAQLALSLGLVAGTGLLARSVAAGAWADPGFESRERVAAFVRLSHEEWDGPTSVALVRRVTTELERLPGVRRVAVGTQVPVAGGQSMGSTAPLGREDEEIQVEFTAVGPGYFETLGIDLVAGRPLGDLDAEPEPVAVVSEALAARFWPGEDPVGRRLAGDPGRRVVGVVADVQMRSLRAEPNPAVYVPFVQGWQPGLAFAVQGRDGAGVEPRAVAEAVEAVVPGVRARVLDIRTEVLRSLDDARRIGVLVGAFSVLALLLAAVGLHGLVAIAAAGRVREFGIRMALGARPASVVHLMLGRAGILALAGVVLGVGAAAVVGRTLDRLLFATSPLDPGALIGAAALLVATAAAAAWLPARRAGRIDAAACLRE